MTEEPAVTRLRRVATERNYALFLRSDLYNGVWSFEAAAEPFHHAKHSDNEWQDSPLWQGNSTLSLNDAASQVLQQIDEDE